MLKILIYYVSFSFSSLLTYISWSLQLLHIFLVAPEVAIPAGIPIKEIKAEIETYRII